MPIRVECDQCGFSVMAPDRYAGRSARCKKCGSIVFIPSLDEAEWMVGREKPYQRGAGTNSIENGDTLPSPPGLVLLLCSLLLTAVIWGVGMSMLYLKEVDGRAGSLATESDSLIGEDSNLSKLKDEQPDPEKLNIQEMRREAEELLAEARAMKLREEEKLHSLYLDLRKLQQGENLVQNKYLHSFEIDRNKLKVLMVNRGRDPVTPSLRIVFFDKHGFVTASATVSWMFSSISPGEKRIEEQGFFTLFGEPVYYMADVDQ